MTANPICRDAYPMRSATPLQPMSRVDAEFWAIRSARADSSTPAHPNNIAGEARDGKGTRNV